jgi:hypothetical protein
MPVKYAVKYSDLDKNTDYVIVEEYSVTGYNFRITEDENGVYDDSVPVRLSGAIPGEKFENYGIRSDTSGIRHKYVLYGEFAGEIDFYGEKFRSMMWMTGIFYTP